MPNHLINESSPYLLLHAHNPVNWYPWGEEALLLAKQQDKPILVSIGYSACHWCHVMEKESFENEAVAKLMNAYFINIKIDREERPDLDHIYMDAVQAITGSGGWPLNVFLTPETRPFYGGTYFPPAKMANRISWTEVLQQIHHAWIHKRNEIEEQAMQLLQHLEKANTAVLPQKIISKAEDDFFDEYECETIAHSLLANADKQEGGFGQAPKFLQLFSLQYLQEHYLFFNNPQALQHVHLSLLKMLQGGIYDQLGGGICRYSTDVKWLVPHFEKMLYDNALLLQLCADALLQTKNAEYKNAIEKTISFLEHEMKAPAGGYYTAIDADSEGKEGAFYVWERSQIHAILGEDAELYCLYYNVTENGNWEHTNILHVPVSAGQFAQEHTLNENEFVQKIASCNEKLLNERNKRIRPATDDKILLAWNALLVTAFCKCFAALQLPAHKERAIQLFAFLENVFSNNNFELKHNYKNGVARNNGFLDDYACFIQAAISMAEMTGDEKYFYKAKDYTEKAIQLFSHEDDTFFYFTPADQKDIIFRKIELYDSVVPSSNSIMAFNLLYLSVIFNLPQWKERVNSMLQQWFPVYQKYPGSFAVWAILYQRLTIGLIEIAVTGNNIIINDINQVYLPHKILQAGQDSSLPLLKGKPLGGDTYIYVCKNYACQLPVRTVGEMNKMLKFKSVD